MTALPATRALAEKLIDRVEGDLRAGELVDFDQKDCDAVVALLRRGAETVGATERWLWMEDSNLGETFLRSKPSPAFLHPRRCLILPEIE